MIRSITKTATYLLLTGLVMMFSCKGRDNRSARKSPKGEKEIKLFCSGTDYFSNKQFYRSNSLGESLDQVTAKKKALSNAKQELASSISSTIKAVTDNYVNSREFNNKEEIAERFESLSREVVNQELRGVKTICEKHTMTEEGKYKTYVALELSGEELIQAMNERLSKDEKLKIDYDYEKFKNTFEEEMEKMSTDY